MANEVELERMVVRLIGDSQSYMKMMKDSQSETKKAQDAIQNMGIKIEQVGAKIRNIGLGMSLAITTPLVGLGYLAQSEFTEFEAALSRMEGLVGIASDEVARFRGEILSLAGPVAKSPVELAKAMEFITGSGIKGNAALETLTATAKAASAGLGETVEVANAVTSAMNAYGPANLSAAKATDILVATVREGKAEASSFAPVFGQVLPLAAEMGISFGEVGGALAFLTRTTGNASIATTQLRSLMTQLLKPTEKSTKALEAMGITANDVSNRIRQEGFVDTVQFLKEKLGEAGLEMKDMVTDTEGLMGALQLAGPQAKIAADMVKTVVGAVNDGEKAFDSFSKTTKFTFAQAMAESKIALIELGEIIAPVMQQLISYQRLAMDAWKGLRAETKQGVVAFAGVLVVLGPTIVALGTVITSLGTVIKAYAAARIAVIAFTASMTGASVASLALGAALSAGVITLLAVTAVQLVKVTSLQDEFNFSLQEGILLNNKLNAIQGGRNQAVLGGVADIKDPLEKQKAITEEINRAQKEIAGYEAAINHANGRLKEMDGWLRGMAMGAIGGDKDRQLEQEGLQQTKQLLEDKKKLVKGLQEELDKMAKKEEIQLKPNKEKYDPKELNKYTESLKAHLGVLESEAIVGKEAAETLEVMKFKLEGATDAQLAVARQTNEAITAQKKQNDLNQSAKDIMESLSNDIVGLGLSYDATADEVSLYQLAVKGANLETINEARVLAKQKKELQDYQKLMSEGAALKKQHLDPAKKLSEETAKLHKMLDMGAIDLDTFNKALKDVQKQCGQEYKVEFKTSGSEAVAAGSAEAMERLREYQYAISGVGPLPMPSDQAIKQGGKEPKAGANSLTSTAEVLNKGSTFLAIADGIKRLVTLAEQKSQEAETVEFVTSGLSDIRG